MLAVRVGPEDGVIMEALSDQSLVDHCVIVDNSVRDSQGESGSRNELLMDDSPSPSTSSHNFAQPVTRIIYHHGSSGGATALLVGQQILQQSHHSEDLHEDDEGLLEEGQMSPQSLHHHHSHHQFKHEDHLRSTLGGVVIEDSEGKLHRQILLEDNSDSVYQTEPDLDPDPPTILVVEKEDESLRGHYEDSEGGEEERVHHRHHHPHESSRLSGSVLTEGSEARDELCRVVESSSVEISSGCAVSTHNGSIVTTGKQTSGSSTLTGSGELGGRGSAGGAQHWLSSGNSPGALIENNASNNTTTRLVVVTSNPSSAQQTLTLHRIVTQVKQELIQTAAEDLSLSNNNNSHSSNHRSSSGSAHRIHQTPSSLSPLVLAQRGLSPRGEELTVIVGRNRALEYLDGEASERRVFGEIHGHPEEESSQDQLGHHLHHVHHHHHHNHVEDEVDDEEEEEPNSPQNHHQESLDPERVSMSSMIDASEFRALHAAASAEHYQVALTTVHNGRLSPTGFSPGTQGGSQYATLTPLQPLPPISTMTDKFSYGHAGGNVAGSFTVMQHNGLGGLSLASNPYSNYEKLPPMCVTPPHHYSTSPVNGLQGDHLSGGSANGLRSDHMSSPPPKSPTNGYSPAFSSPNDQSRHRNTPDLSPSPLQQQNNHPSTSSASQSTSNHPHHHGHHSLLIHGNGVASPNSSEHSSPPLATAVVVAHRDPCSPARSPSPLSVILSGTQASSHPHISHTQSLGQVINNVKQQSVVSVVSSSASPGGVVTLTSTPAGSAGSISSAGSTSGELEEINTKELAARISAELKRYSIPQAIFAQRVLCRSQGTLSDLLRNPKPWSKLKSGRETFRRMWKWLQEPEFQRMSALRLAGKPTLSSSSPSFTSPSCVSSSPSSATTYSSVSANATLENDHHVSLLLYQPHGPMSGNVFAACKRKEEQQTQPEPTPAPKKPRLVFTDLQRRTLQAIFKETKRPSKEMQVTIARQLGLEPTTVGNFFMNARRRSMDKWKEDQADLAAGGGKGGGSSASSAASNSPSSSLSGQSGAHAQLVTVHHTPTIISQHSGASMDGSDVNL